MTTAPALLPCPVPWCGSRHISLESFGGDKLFVARCPSCGARSPASRSQSEAIAAWNARPGDAARETAIIEAIQALIDAGDYFSARADVNDGDYGVPSPNREMTLASQCGEALERLEALRTHGASHD